jgi:hypothetical protein
MPIQFSSGRYPTSNVSNLKKDDNGVWRGKASKGGSSTQVSVDSQGNVNPVK